jgi:hypothetical protein
VASRQCDQGCDQNGQHGNKQTGSPSDGWKLPDDDLKAHTMANEVPATADVGRDPSAELWSCSRKWRRLPKISSRSRSIDHGSPSTSMAALIAHPDLGGR